MQNHASRKRCQAAWVSNVRTTNLSQAAVFYARPGTARWYAACTSQVAIESFPVLMGAMRFSLRMVVLLVAALSAALALLVIATPSATLTSDLTLLALLLLAVTLTIGAAQPARSFWMTTGLIAFAVALFLLTDMPLFDELRSSLADHIVRPAYDVLHKRPEGLNQEEAYQSGDTVTIRNYRLGGRDYGRRSISPKQAEAEGIDLETIPFVSAYTDFRRIAYNLLAIALGTACGGLALWTRRRAMANAASEAA
jgi:hypothetical protein